MDRREARDGMHRLRRQVPSLGALAAFEAAARLGSFTRAAADLGVTQAAVSRRIGELERELGRALFVRAHRRVELSAAGRVLAEAVGQSFERMADAVEVVRLSGGPDTLTVGATTAFAHFWLLPRLSSFREAYPHLHLRVISEDVADRVLDEAVDVVLRYGRPPFRIGASLASMAEAVFPVCSPAFAARAGEDVARLPLIESDAPEPSWLSWAQWLARAGIPGPPVRPTLRFTSYSDAAYAAMAGEGVALGWARLLERPLADGRLVRLGEAVVRPEERHHLIVPDGRPPCEPIDAFVQWAERLFDPSSAGGDPDDPPTEATAPNPGGTESRPSR